MGVGVGGGKAAVRGAAQCQQGTEEPGRGIRGAHFRALLHGHDPHRAGQAVHRAGAAGAAAGGRAEAGGAPAAQLRRAAGGADPCYLRLLCGGGFFAAGSPQRAAAGAYPGERRYGSLGLRAAAGLPHGAAALCRRGRGLLFALLPAPRSAAGAYHGVFLPAAHQSGQPAGAAAGAEP